jgi:hypothetical protein
MKRYRVDFNGQMTEDPEGLFVLASDVLPELKRLREAELFLECLSQAGVDNWEWYGEARTAYQEALENMQEE